MRRSRIERCAIFFAKNLEKKCDLPPLTYTAVYVIINSVKGRYKKRTPDRKRKENLTNQIFGG